MSLVTLRRHTPQQHGPKIAPPTLREAGCGSTQDSTTSIDDSAHHLVKLLRVAQVVTSSIKNAQDSSKVDRSAPAIDRVAPAICDDLHNCAGWPPADNRELRSGPCAPNNTRLSSSSTVFDSSTCYTMRSMCLERNVHSFPSEARVLSKPSLKNG